MSDAREPGSTSIGPSAGEFKVKCAQLLDEVAETRQPMVTTTPDEPVARQAPMPPPVKLRGALKGSFNFEGDIVSPLASEWGNMRNGVPLLPVRPGAGEVTTELVRQLDTELP